MLVGQKALGVVAEHDDVGRGPPRSRSISSPRPRRARAGLLPVEAQQLLTVAEHPELVGRPLARRPTTARVSMPCRRAAASRASPAVVRADDAAQADPGAEGRDLAGDVGGAAEPVIRLADPDHRHRRLGRDAVHLARHVLVEHDVAGDPDVGVRGIGRRSTSDRRWRRVGLRRSWLVPAEPASTASQIVDAERVDLLDARRRPDGAATSTSARGAAGRRGAGHGDDGAAAARAGRAASMTFGELPLVLMATSRSPGRASASTWRANTLLVAVVVGDRGQGRRAVGGQGERRQGPAVDAKRQTSSAARCWASAALPPLPHTSSLSPAPKQACSSPATCSSAVGQRSAAAAMTWACS